MDKYRTHVIHDRFESTDMPMEEMLDLYTPECWRSYWVTVNGDSGEALEGGQAFWHPSGDLYTAGPFGKIHGPFPQANVYLIEVKQHDFC